MSGVSINDSSLVTNYTAARAGYLDELNIGGIVAQDADTKYLLRTAVSGQVASSIADIVNTLISRVTAARAGYFDNLNIGGNVAQDADAKYLLRTAITGQVTNSIADIVNTLLSRVTGAVPLAANYTTARAGYLDNLNIGGNVAQDVDAKYLLRTAITGQVANSIADIVNTLLSRVTGAVPLAANYTTARAGYLDNLNIGGNVAQDVDGKYLLRTAITGQVANSIADIVNTLLSRLTSARAGYLDNLNAGAVLATPASVWTNATRTLTSLNGAISSGSVGKTSIGASSTVTVQPSANHIFDISAAGDQVNVTGGLFDGTNAIGGQTTTPAVGNLLNVTSFVGTTNSVYLQIKNQDGASAHSYMYTYKSINIS